MTIALKQHKKNIAALTNKVMSPAVAFYTMAVFLIFVFLTGGGARDDIQSLILLRPFSILLIAYAYIYKQKHDIKWRSFPLYLILALAAIMIVQLIPLPPDIWTQLPKRQIFAEIATMAEIEQPWRPISLSPSKTWNSLFALAIPLAAMILFMNIDPKDRKKTMLVIMSLIALSAIWGILQTLGSARGPLYLYRITNNGSAVGLFANRNHQAFMLACLILFLGWYSFYLQMKTKVNLFKLSITFGGIFILIPLIFITGSRAGLILMIPASLCALYFFYVGGQSNRAARAAKSSKSSKRTTLIGRIKRHSNILILLAIVIAIASIVLGSIIFSRSLAFDRLFADGAEELRVKVAPILLTMASDYMPFGSGFGSFEHIYRIYEPIELLSPTYFNQAHNDWLQLLIEGGAALAIILFTAILWTGRQFLFIMLNWKKLGRERNTAIMCLVFFILASAASIGDYPLRIPSIISIAAIICVYFNQKMSELKKDING